MTTITLTPAELLELTGYSQPAAQLQALHKQGYWRARRSITGAVVLTRAHFEAIERGEDRQAPQQKPAPQLRLAGAVGSHHRHARVGGLSHA
ncbi:MAG: hypothetical protein RIQ60_3586 [Pseudomonadota bacterium]|jgi:hypothetical protein